MSIGLIIAALFLPPLAIYLNEGVSRNFWIGFGLTCLGFVPGIIFAFFTLLKKRPPEQSPQQSA